MKGKIKRTVAHSLRLSGVAPKSIRDVDHLFLTGAFVFSFVLIKNKKLEIKQIHDTLVGQIVQSFGILSALIVYNSQF